MIRFSEPNTKDFEQRVLDNSAFEEHVEGDQHCVHVVNPERVRGFPVKVNLEEGENNPEGLNDDGNENVLDEAEVQSGCVPTTPPKSDQGSDREQPGKRPGSSAEEKLVPGPPDPEDPDDPEGGDSDDPSRRNIPELEGNLLFQNERLSIVGCLDTSAIKIKKMPPAHAKHRKNTNNKHKQPVSQDDEFPLRLLVIRRSDYNLIMRRCCILKQLGLVAVILAILTGGTFRRGKKNYCSAFAWTRVRVAWVWMAQPTE